VVYERIKASVMTRKPNYSTERCPCPTLSTTVPKWTALRSNLDLRGVKPAINRQSCFTSARVVRAL